MLYVAINTKCKTTVRAEYTRVMAQFFSLIIHHFQHSTFCNDDTPWYCRKPLSNGSEALKLNLGCHWLKGFPQRQTALITQDPGVHFTTGFFILILIQIRHGNVDISPSAWSYNDHYGYCHMIIQLSWHMQKFLAIRCPEFELQQKQFPWDLNYNGQYFVAWPHTLVYRIGALLA